VTAAPKSLRQRITNELGLFFGLLFVGFVLIPIAIFMVGGSIFGDYGAGDYSAFFATLSGRIRNWDKVAWFLVLAPYLGILVLRLTAWAWQRTTPR